MARLSKSIRYDQYITITWYDIISCFFTVLKIFLSCELKILKIHYVFVVGEL